MSTLEKPLQSASNWKFAFVPVLRANGACGHEFFEEIFCIASKKFIRPLTFLHSIIKFTENL